MSKDVKFLHVPQFEGLTVESMLAYGNQYPEVMRALPTEPHERLKLHRSYIANVIYPIVGKPFWQWVQNIMQARTQEIIKDQNMKIEMDPQVYAAFQASTAVSGKLMSLGMIIISIHSFPWHQWLSHEGDEQAPAHQEADRGR